MPIEWFVGLRFLREGRTQSILIIAGVSVGVGVMIFLSALISGLQKTLIRQTLSTQAHVVVRPPEEIPRSLHQDEGLSVTTRVERPAQRIRSIPDWQQVLDDLSRTPGVAATSPMVAGPGLAVRATASRSVNLMGIDPLRFERIVELSDRLTAGQVRVAGNDAVVGIELARELGLRVGDKVRLVAANDRNDLFTVTGIFDLGNREVNRRWLLVSLRNAQTLLDLAGGISSIDLKVTDLFGAEKLAQEIQSRTGLVVESWMKTNAQLLVGLRSQSASSQMIQVFVTVAVAMGIASVLAVSVVQRSKQIGILRAMGISRQRVIGIFLLQGGVVGLVGSAFGIALGSVLSLVFASLAQNPDGSPTFPVDLDLALFLRSVAVATATGLVAAVVPARKAAKLEPAVAIHHV
jgi:lipoprotein-releasing system permease protein